MLLVKLKITILINLIKSMVSLIRFMYSEYDVYVSIMKIRRTLRFKSRIKEESDAIVTIS